MATRAIDVVKWPKKSEVPDLTMKEFKALSRDMKPFVGTLIADQNTKDAVFTLGTSLAGIHALMVEETKPAIKANYQAQYDWVLAVYDKLFERLL